MTAPGSPAEPARSATRERDRRIARLAIPSLGTLAVEPLYVLVDTAIVGRLGTVPLAGVAVAAVVLTTLLSVFNFLAYGTTARVAFLTGRGDHRSAAAVAAQGLWLCALVGIPLAAAVAGATPVLVDVVGGEGDVAAAARTYLRISTVSIPAVLVALVGHGYLRGVADPRTPLVVAVVANVFNLVLELFLVYGLDLGVAGSAWSTVAAQWVAAVWFFALLAPRIVRHHATLRLIGAEVRRLLTAGRHLFFRTAALLATHALATSAAARIDAPTLGGHQIVMQVHLFIALALDALAIPGQILVGTALGGDDREEARATGDRLLRLGAAAGVLVGLVLVVATPVLPYVFTEDPAVVDRARAALLVAGLVQVPAGVAFVLDGILIGASDFRFLQWSMLVALAVFLPVGVAVLLVPSLGILGLWCGILLWMTARAAANVLRYRRGAWLQKL